MAFPFRGRPVTALTRFAWLGFARQIGEIRRVYSSSAGSSLLAIFRADCSFLDLLRLWHRLTFEFAYDFTNEEDLNRNPSLTPTRSLVVRHTTCAADAGPEILFA